MNPTVIHVREEALARNAARYGDPVWMKDGTRVTLYLRQPLFNVDGAHYANAIVEVIGRRTFGRLVEFGIGNELEVSIRSMDPVHGRSNLSLVPAADFEYLRQSGAYLVEELAKLCRCGKLPTHCDCCPRCHGSGYSRLTPSLVDCSTCHGKGYREGSKDAPGRPLDAP
jgi:hypothetical protein